MWTLVEAHHPAGQASPVREGRQRHALAGARHAVQQQVAAGLLLQHLEQHVDDRPEQYQVLPARRILLLNSSLADYGPWLA